MFFFYFYSVGNKHGFQMMTTSVNISVIRLVCAIHSQMRASVYYKSEIYRKNIPCPSKYLFRRHALPNFNKFCRHILKAFGKTYVRPEFQLQVDDVVELHFRVMRVFRGVTHYFDVDDLCAFLNTFCNNLSTIYKNPPLQDIVLVEQNFKFIGASTGIAEEYRDFFRVFVEKFQNSCLKYTYHLLNCGTGIHICLQFGQTTVNPINQPLSPPCSLADFNQDNSLPSTVNKLSTPPLNPSAEFQQDDLLPSILNVLSSPTSPSNFVIDYLLPTNSSLDLDLNSFLLSTM